MEQGGRRDKEEEGGARRKERQGGRSDEEEGASRRVKKDGPGPVMVSDTNTDVDKSGGRGQSRHRR